MSTINPLEVAMWLVVGAMIGGAYFSLLRREIGLLAAHAAAFRIVLFHLIRVAMALVAFWTIAQRGGLPLLLALLGFVIARHVVQRSIRRV